MPLLCEEDEAVADHPILRVQGHIGGAKEDQGRHLPHQGPSLPPFEQ